MKVRWSPSAKQHLSDIVDFIALENPYAAVCIDYLLRKSTRRLADFLESGRPGLIPGTRELLPHRSYRIVYEIDGLLMRIVAVVHAARQWPPVAEGDA